MSYNFAVEKRRRTEQFERSLAPMHHRTVQLVKDCCFAIIDERHEDFRTTPALKVTKRVEKPLAVPIGESRGDMFNTVREEPADFSGWSDEGWRQDETSHRFIQFIFLEHHFEMDLPRPMLWPTEAKSILKSRSGFFFLGERGDNSIHADTIKTFHPLRKVYVHGDNYSAAVDVAYIFFTLWRFPIDSTLYLSTFGSDETWDDGKPLN